MGQAVLCYEVMPESIELMDALEARLKELKPESLSKRPVAFGLCAFDVSFVFDDKVGGDTDVVEKKLEALEGVGSVKNTGITLI
ncbi:MAG: hypothetical protein ACP5E4_00775 [Candidatus Aenigmatarchaeota archaeon]